MNGIQLLHVLNLATRGYRFNVSYDGSEYHITEQYKCGMNIKNNNKSVRNKTDVIKEIKFNFLGRDYIVPNIKEYEFFLTNNNMINNYSGQFNIFFHDTIKFIIGKYLRLEKELVANVGIMNIDLRKNIVTFSDVFTDGGRFITSLDINIDFVNRYIDIVGLLFVLSKKIVKDRKKLYCVDIILNINNEFNSINDKYLFDLPMFFNCYSEIEDIIDSGEDYLSIYEVFSDKYWEGNFANFIR
jgi:hypothetical protein